MDNANEGKYFILRDGIPIIGMPSFAAFVRIREEKKHMKTKQLVISAMLIAIATVLSLLKLFELPFGGTVTIASMMPIVIIAYLYGTRWGLLSAFAFSIIQLLCGMGTVSAFFLPGDSQMAVASAITICLLDYILAYTALGFAGVFRGKFGNDVLEILVGAILACILRSIVHIISGAVFFGAWAEWFFADSTGLSQISALKGFCDWVMATFTGTSLSVFYSVIYNMAYMLPETIITAIVSPAVFKIIRKSKIA